MSDCKHEYEIYHKGGCLCSKCDHFISHSEYLEYISDFTIAKKTKQIEPLKELIIKVHALGHLPDHWLKEAKAILEE